MTKLNDEPAPKWKGRVWFDPAPFECSHGRKPRGRGSWAFSVSGREGDPLFSPSMTYADARRWMTAQVRAMPDLSPDVRDVWVLVLS